MNLPVFLLFYIPICWLMLLTLSDAGRLFKSITSSKGFLYPSLMKKAFLRSWPLPLLLHAPCQNCLRFYKYVNLCDAYLLPLTQIVHTCWASLNKISVWEMLFVQHTNMDASRVLSRLAQHATRMYLQVLSSVWCFLLAFYTYTPAFWCTAPDKQAGSKKQKAKHQT